MQQLGINHAKAAGVGGWGNGDQKWLPLRAASVNRKTLSPPNFLPIGLIPGLNLDFAEAQPNQSFLQRISDPPQVVTRSVPKL
jgi:hypothetical protein